MQHARARAASTFDNDNVVVVAICFYISNCLAAGPLSYPQLDEGALDGALESPRPKEALVQLLTSDEPGPPGEALAQAGAYLLLQYYSGLSVALAPLDAVVWHYIL